MYILGSPMFGYLRDAGGKNGTTSDFDEGRSERWRSRIPRAQPAIMLQAVTRYGWER